MNDDLRHVPFLLELARKTRSVIAQNIGGSILLAIVGLVLAATGMISIWIVPLYYLLGYLFVIFNSARLVRFGEEFSSIEDARRRLEATQPIKPTREAQQVKATAAPAT